MESSAYPGDLLTDPLTDPYLQESLPEAKGVLQN